MLCEQATPLLGLFLVRKLWPERRHVAASVAFFGLLCIDLSQILVLFRLRN